MLAIIISYSYTGRSSEAIYRQKHSMCLLVQCNLTTMTMPVFR